MAVRDYRELTKASFEIINFDRAFDMARAIKSEEELAGIRHSMKIIEDGFWAMLAKYAPGKTEAEVMAPAVDKFFAGGAGLQMMNIVLSGTQRLGRSHVQSSARSQSQRRRSAPLFARNRRPRRLLGGIFAPADSGKISATTKKMADVYPEALEASRVLMREGEPIKNVHKASADIFAKQGFALGHLSGHSIGMTMIEHPAIGANSETLLRENMIFSFHPQVVDQDGKVCLYTQDTYRVGKKEGENLANVDWKFYSGAEKRDEGAMKICIVGTGAIGSIFGAHLARVEGVEVHAYDVSQGAR